MAEPVMVPIQLEVTDIDTSNMNFKDVQKTISKQMSGIRKSMTDTFKGIDATAINKPIEAAMTSVKKSVQAAEDAQLRYNEALVRAGASTQEYKSAVESIKMAISSQESLINDLSQLGAAGAPHLAEAQKELDALIEARNKINPLDFVDKAQSIYLEKVANTYKKVLSATDNVNKQTEKFNQTIQDNKLTDEYNEYLKQAEAYKKKLEELNDKSKRMADLGATDKQWEALRYDTEQISTEMDNLIKKMREAVTTGKAFRFGEGNKGELSRQINSYAMSVGNRAGNIQARAVANESPFTDEYQKALDELDKLEKKMESLREKSTKMLELGASKQQFQNLVYDAEQLDIKIDEVKNHLMNMVNEGGAFKFSAGDAEAEIGRIRDKSNSLQSALSGIVGAAQGAQGGLTALGATHPKLAAILGVVQKIGTGFGKVMVVAGKVGQAIVKGFTGAVKVLRTVGSVIGSIAKGLLNGVRSMNIFSKSGNNASNSMNKGFKKLTRNIMMFGLGFRTAYYLIKRLRTIFIEGFKQMGDQFEEFGAPMKEMMMSFERLKGSLATAFQPLVSVVMPILTRFMNYLTGVLEGVGKFMATLTGQGHIYKAVAKDINSVSKAAKDANKQLGSYDKLEVIQKDNSGVEYEKQTVGETESAASSFAQMVKDAWAKADFTGVGQYVTTQLLAVLDNVEKNIIPKVTSFINRLLKSINTFFDGFDSEAIGAKLGSIVNTIMTGIDWSQVGLFFANLYNEVWAFFDGLISGIDWTLLGQSLNTGLTTLVGSLNFESLASMTTGLTMGIFTAISQIDWAYLATTLLAGLQTVLQTMGDAMASSDNPILAGFGNVILAINDAITLLTPVMETLIASISPIIQSILPVISTLLPPIAEIIATAAELVLPLVVSLFETFMPILGKLIEIVLPLFLDILNSLQPIFDVLVETVLPVFVKLLDALMPLIEGVLGLVTDIIAPIVELIAPLLEIVFKILDPVITILEPILDILGTFCDLLGDLLRPILEALTPILEAVSEVFGVLNPVISVLATPLNVLAGIFKTVASVAKGVLVPALNIIKTVIAALMDVVKTIAKTFNAAFSAVQSVIEKVGNAIKKPINAILGGVEKVANGVIRAVNGMIKALNKLSFDVPDWVPGIGGKKFGFNLKEINTISIPRLAQGAVIPPNKEFLAMLGDQKRGTNIEAPLDTIKQALAEVMAEIGGGNREPIVLQVNGRTLAKVVWDEQEKRYRQTGRYSMA